MGPQQSEINEAGALPFLHESLSVREGRQKSGLRWFEHCLRKTGGPRVKRNQCESSFW